MGIRAPSTIGAQPLARARSRLQAAEVGAVHGGGEAWVRRLAAEEARARRRRQRPPILRACTKAPVSSNCC